MIIAQNLTMTFINHPVSHSNQRKNKKKRRWMNIHRLDIAEGNILYGLVAPFYGIQK
jgi:hypothetical protein